MTFFLDAFECLLLCCAAWIVAEGTVRGVMLFAELLDERPERIH